MIDPKDIKIDDFDYPLPDERIARYPLSQRDKCKLLVRDTSGKISTLVFDELPDLLPNDSMLVYNNTRVINARLRFKKGDDNSGATIEIFCLEPQSPRDYARCFESTSRCSWICFVGNSKRWKTGLLKMNIDVDGTEIILTANRVSRDDNSSTVEFCWNNNDVTFARLIEAAGEIPIPPYLNRSTEQSDSTDYQTVYSHIDGSVAAPTAGLHFTDRILNAIDTRSIPRRELTLHVGAGTFQPVKSENIGDHPMHSEFIAVDRTLISELSNCDRRVIAVGTTSVRTLESLYHIGCLIHSGQFEGEVPQWYPYSLSHPRLTVADSMAAILRYLDERQLPSLVAATRIIIAPGYTYKIVKGMVTNFHQPRSTLLLLVSAFVDGDWKPVYNHALTNGYRFLSYGDASLLLK